MNSPTEGDLVRGIGNVQVCNLYFHSHPTHTLLASWHPLQCTAVMLNFNGSSSTSVAAIFLIWDSIGNCVASLASHTFHLDTTFAMFVELIAMRNGIQHLLYLEFLYIEIKGENLLTFKAVNNQCRVPWKCVNLVIEIQSLLYFMFSVGN